MKKKKSTKTKLINSPRTEPCGTLKGIEIQPLYEELTLVFRVLFDK